MFLCRLLLEIRCFTHSVPWVLTCITRHDRSVHISVDVSGQHLVMAQDVSTVCELLARVMSELRLGKIAFSQILFSLGFFHVPICSNCVAQAFQAQDCCLCVIRCLSFRILWLLLLMCCQDFKQVELPISLSL